MEVLVTGATGFIGRALVQRLLRDGHSVSALVRNVEQARAVLPTGVVAISELDGLAGAPQAVVNLAGAPIAKGRWTRSRKAVLLDSRLDTTQQLVRHFRQGQHRPRVLISASGVGYYGDRPNETLVEHSEPGGAFTSQVCRGWEDAAIAAESLGIRVVRLRFGIVLGSGGALSAMLPAFRLGLGAVLGDGKQVMPWIHLHDALEVICAALDNGRYDGALNVVAPQSTTNAQFTRALGATVRRWTPWRIPAAALRVGLGERAALLLDSQHVEPARLRTLDFHFKYPALAEALRELH